MVINNFFFFFFGRILKQCCNVLWRTLEWCLSQWVPILPIWRAAQRLQHGSWLLHAIPTTLPSRVSSVETIKKTGVTEGACSTQYIHVVTFLAPINKHAPKRGNHLLPLNIPFDHFHPVHRYSNTKILIEFSKTTLKKQPSHSNQPFLCNSSFIVDVVEWIQYTIFKRIDQRVSSVTGNSAFEMTDFYIVRLFLTGWKKTSEAKTVLIHVQKTWNSLSDLQC